MHPFVFLPSIFETLWTTEKRLSLASSYDDQSISIKWQKNRRTTTLLPAGFSVSAGETSLPRSSLCSSRLLFHVYTFKVAPRLINTQFPDIPEGLRDVLSATRNIVVVPSREASEKVHLPCVGVRQELYLAPVCGESSGQNLFPFRCSDICLRWIPQRCRYGGWGWIGWNVHERIGEIWKVKHRIVRQNHRRQSRVVTSKHDHPVQMLVLAGRLEDALTLAKG